MRRLLLFIVLMFFISLVVSSKEFNFESPIKIILHLTNVDENNEFKEDHHRSIYCAVIKDNVITFDSFDEDCSMQIVDVDNDLVIHEELILSGDTQSILPILPSGNYKVKFVGYESVYSGYFEIR